MSQPAESAVSIELGQPLSATKQRRVVCFVDGFNLYHALNWFDGGTTEEQKRQYRKYKWLSLTGLASCYISPVSQKLVDVHYFTTFTISRDAMKVLRHRLYIWAQESEGVKVSYGAFREALVQCKGACEQWYTIQREKQTDVKIAMAIAEMARKDLYDRALIVSGDADLIPAIMMVRNDYPEKDVAVVVPIGRRGHDIESACHSKYTMTEDHLRRSQMPDKLKHPSGKHILKPEVYR